MEKKLCIGVIGYGYWGPNIVRNFIQNKYTTVKYVSDLDLKRGEAVKDLYPDVTFTNDYKEILLDDEIDAVAIITPLTTHFAIAKEALEANKHVFLEKPMAGTSVQCQELVALAERRQKVLMVGHIFVYASPVQKIKEILDKKELGDIYYFESIRTNLGPYRADTSVVWDLASHDLAIIEYLFKKKPFRVSATGGYFFGDKHCDVAYSTVVFEDNLIANINTNWIAPTKIRKIVIGGSKKMLLWDDIETETKIKIYDKGFIFANNDESKEKTYNTLVEYRIGDMYSPAVDTREALKEEISHFCDCICNKKRPLSDGTAGLQVVKILEAIEMSIRSDGKPVNLVIEK